MLFFFLVGVVLNGAGQIGKKKNLPVDIIRHEVQLGETIRMLSKKYLVDPADIYFMNKFAVNGIKQGMMLQIPVPRKESVVAATEPDTVSEQTAPGDEPVTGESEENKSDGVKVIDRTAFKNYTVRPHETLYSIAKKQNVSVDEIKLSNENILRNGLKSGMVIKIPGTRVLAQNESSIGSEETPVSEVSSVKSSRQK